MSPCPNSRRDQGYRVLIDDPCVGHREGVTEIKQSGADLHVAYFDNSVGIDPFRALCPSNLSGGLSGMDALAGPAVSILSDGGPDLRFPMRESQKAISATALPSASTATVAARFRRLEDQGNYGLETGISRHIAAHVNNERRVPHPLIDVEAVTLIFGTVLTGARRTGIQRSPIMEGAQMRPRAVGADCSEKSVILPALGRPPRGRTIDLVPLWK